MTKCIVCSSPLNEWERSTGQVCEICAAGKKQDDEEKRLLEKAKRNRVLPGQLFEPTKHDWYKSGPYRFRCVEIGKESKNWHTSLTQTLNQMADKGWEFYRSESLIREIPNGCLMAFLGRPIDYQPVTVLVFRRPYNLQTK